MSLRNSNIIIFIILSLLFANISCKDKDDVIPYVYIDFYLYLSDPDFSNLNAVGNYVYVTGGFSGIVIYRKSLEEFVAFDRACTFQPSKECERVEIDESGLFAICPCCNSKYTITDGYVYEGVATRPLKEYGTSYDGNNTLHIFN